MPKSVSVLVIGAGISGITAAKTLLAAGFEDVKILEATNRTGGRIWTVNLDSTDTCSQTSKQAWKAELGANFIHGVEQNPVYIVANENNLLQLRTLDLGRKTVITLTEDGQEVSARLAQDVDWKYGMLMQRCEEFYHGAHQNIVGLPPTSPSLAGTGDSLGTFMRQEIANYLQRFVGDDRRHRELLFMQRLSHEAVLCGSNDLDEVSLGEIGSYEELPGINYVVPPGFESVVDVLKKSIPPESILLGHIVRHIDWQHVGGNGGVQGRAGDRSADNHTEYVCCVECENDTRFYADHVIVTVSLGYLKKEASRLFSPALPEEKLAAIGRLGYGVVDKIILEFPEPILDDKVRRLDLLWDSDENHSSMDDEAFIAATWYKRLSSFDLVGPTSLMGWLTGKAAVYVENLPDEEVISKCLFTLEKFLKKSLPKPKKLIRSKWAMHTYAQGAYTYVPVGGSALDIETLSDPLPFHAAKPSLLFAGEATHMTYYSTTHGALLSGQREAERIINMYNQVENGHECTDSDDSEQIFF